MYGTLWAYSTVFSNALSSHVPLFGQQSYTVYLLIFACTVAPISCLELKETVTLQVILAFGRVLMVVLMIGTVVVSSQWGSENDFGDNMKSDATPKSFDFQGIHHLLPIATFANIFHHSIPALSEPVIDKTKLSRIFAVTLLCCFVAYSVIGSVVSLYFGSNTLSSSNLNWVEYGSNASGFKYVVMRCISGYVVLFPALDVSSAFPLNAVTLGNNLLSIFYGQRVHAVENSRIHRVMFRLLAAIPPIILASIVSDLGRITDYTGITGFGIAFIFPSLLSYYSRISLSNKGMTTSTIYSNILTEPLFGILLVLFGCFLLVYVPASLVFYND
jgi:hypothetical protein